MHTPRPTPVERCVQVRRRRPVGSLRESLEATVPELTPSCAGSKGLIPPGTDPGFIRSPATAQSAADYERKYFLTTLCEGVVAIGVAAPREIAPAISRQQIALAICPSRRV